LRPHARTSDALVALTIALIGGKFRDANPPLESHSVWVFVSLASMALRVGSGYRPAGAAVLLGPGCSRELS